MRFAMLALILVACGSQEPAQPPVETDTGVDAPAVVDAPEVAVPFDGGAKDRPEPEDRSDVPPVRDVPAVEVIDAPAPPDVQPDRPDTGPACVSMTVGNCCGVACATPPRGTAACVMGACGVGACMTGYGDCDGMVANGCETNVNSSPSHCGMCGAPCADGRVCVRGACVVNTCRAGYAECDGASTTFCETRIENDPMNCGECGRRCATGLVCSRGVCMATCTSPDALCDARCEDTRVSVLNCGGCGMLCPSPRVCRNGACLN